MKKYIFVFLLVLGMFAAAGVQAQVKVRRSDAPNFPVFLTKFCGAVRNNKQAAVASLTQFPFSYGDEGRMTRRQFIRRFSEIFGQQPKGFLRDNQFILTKTRKDTFQVSTGDAVHLVFIRRAGSDFRAILPSLKNNYYIYIR